MLVILIDSSDEMGREKGRKANTDLGKKNKTRMESPISLDIDVEWYLAYLY